MILPAWQKLLKPFRRSHPSPLSKGGFTLLELLVALIMASIVVTGMLSFVVSIINRDRKELAKTTGQQEVQDAVDFITRDMQEAIYVYDSVGLSTTNGIGNRIPPGPAGTTGDLGDCTNANCRPVLVFWKRRSLDRCDTLAGVGGRTSVGIVTGQRIKTIGGNTANNTPATTDLDSSTECRKGDDMYLYSLVAYYLIYTGQGDSTWSRAARIARFEVRDGVRNPNELDPEKVFETKPAIPPDNGFFPFELSINATTEFKDIETSMNNWKDDTEDTSALKAKTSSLYDNYQDYWNQTYPATSLQVLVDYIDDTPLTSATSHQFTAVNNLMQITLDNASSNPTASPPVYGAADQECQNPAIGAMGANEAVRVPQLFNSASSNPVDKLTSFYACVNSRRNAAKIYLRGNTMVRLFQTAPIAKRPITRNNTVFLPQAEVQVYGRGLFNQIKE